MKNSTSTPEKSLKAQTNIYAFLKVVPNLKALSDQSIIKLSERFAVSPESFALLLHIAVTGGTFYEN